MTGTILMREQGDGSVAITADKQWLVVEDEATGDWLAHVPDGELTEQQGEYLLTKSGAVCYALERVGLIDGRQYRRAPDRT